jgi:hypothetical protein
MKPTIIIAVCFIASVRLASAQTHQEAGIFVQGGAFATFEERSHSELDTPGALALLAPDESSGTAAGGSAGVGVFLRPFLSARADVAFTGEYDGPYPAAIPLTIADFPTDVIRQTASSRTKSAEVQALLAYHLSSSNRFRLALLTGVSFARQRTHFSSELFFGTVPPLPGVTRVIPTRQIEYSLITYRRDLVIGADGEIALGEHVAVIPQLRVMGGSGSVTIRPGVSVRWRP